MTGRLFVDTGALVAKVMASDQFNPLAVPAWKQLELETGRIFSTGHVFDEALTLVARRAGYFKAAEWGEALLESGIVWLETDPQDFQEALNWMRKFSDQKISFTDCLSAAVMKRAGLRNVFGFDRHFETMGFKLWTGEK